VRLSRSPATRLGGIPERVANRTKVIGGVRDDRHALTDQLFVPGVTALQRLDQRRIFTSNNAFEILPLSISTRCGRQLSAQSTCCSRPIAEL
jgi:hypothetical protein